MRVFGQDKSPKSGQLKDTASSYLCSKRLRRLVVIQWILREDAFSLSSGEQIHITGDKDGRGQVLRVQRLAGHQGSRQLNSVIPTQTVILGQFDGSIDHCSVDRQDDKALVTILEEATQCPISLLLGDAARRPAFGRQSSSYLCQRDFGEKNRVLSTGIGDSADPSDHLPALALHLLQYTTPEQNQQGTV